MKFYTFILYYVGLYVYVQDIVQGLWRLEKGIRYSGTT